MIGQKGEYRLLLLNGHASHVSTKTIENCVSRKIILLCLPPHTTHLLQPLDVGAFSPLSFACKKRIHQRTEYAGSGYSIDKCTFWEVLTESREETLTPINIQKAWEATGLFPYNPQLILKQLPATNGHSPVELESEPEQYYLTITHKRPNIPPEATISDKNGHTAILTPINIAHV